MRDRFQELKGGFTDDGAAAAELFNDTLLEMNTVIDGIKIAIGEELLPTMTVIIEVIRDWVAANRDVLKQRLTEFISEVTTAAQRLGPALAELATAVEVLLPLFLDLIGDTAELIRDWDLLTDLIEEDFGPAIDGLTAPIRLVIGVFDILVTTIEAVGDGIQFVLDKLAGAEGTIRDFVDAAFPVLGFVAGAGSEPPPAPRGAEDVSPQAPQSGQAPTLLATASSKQLKEAIANRRNTEAARQAARDFLPVAEAREGAQRVAVRAQLRNLGTSGASLAKGIGAAFRGVGEELVGGVTGVAQRAIPSKRKAKRGKGGRAKGAADLSKKDRAFEDLLTADSLRKRVAEGDVTPTILITVTNFNISQDITAPINITGLSSTTAQEVRALIQTEFDEMQEQAVRRGVQDVESMVAR